MKKLKRKLLHLYFLTRGLMGNRTKWKMVYKYYKMRGRVPNFDHPTDLSEWMMANIAYRRNDVFAPFADKVAVKQYVAGKGLGHIVPQNLGVWSRAEDIDWDSLPEKFAIKANHGCGYNLFCHDKSTFDRAAAIEKLNRWVNETYNPIESHYSLIQPLIFAEEFLDDAGKYPIDYRIYCFHGQPVVIDCTISTDNNPTSSSRHYIFDTDWRYMTEYCSHVYDDLERLPRPENLDRMLDYARTLSADFDFVRVDLYNFNGKIWFGELTFSPSAGSFGQFNDTALRELYAKMICG